MKRKINKIKGRIRRFKREYYLEVCALKAVAFWICLMAAVSGMHENSRTSLYGTIGCLVLLFGPVVASGIHVQQLKIKRRIRNFFKQNEVLFALLLAFIMAPIAAASKDDSK